MLDADTAYELEDAVRTTVATQRSHWVRLAILLRTAHDERVWEARSSDLPSFAAWLAQPEIGMSYRKAKDMIDGLQVMHIDHGIDLDLLASADPSKVAVVLPAVRKGRVPVDEALADAITLARSDLRDRYRRGNPNEALDAAREPELCPTCSRPMPRTKPERPDVESLKNASGDSKPAGAGPLSIAGEAAA